MYGQIIKMNLNVLILIKKIAVLDVVDVLKVNISGLPNKLLKNKHRSKKNILIKNKLFKRVRLG